MPREAHTAQDIDLEDLDPLRIRDFAERLHSKDADIVDEHIDGGHGVGELLHAFGRAQISGNPGDGRARARAQPGDRVVHARLGPPVDDNRRTLGG